MVYRLLGMVIAYLVLWAGTPANAYAEIDARDRELLVRVRQAGLWEGPVSRQAEQRASGQRVREVGRKLAGDHDHDRLDVQVRAATRDDAMRSFAQAAVDTVMRHMTLLESTGIAETTSLMVVPGGGGLDGGDVTLGVLMAGIAAGATFCLVRLLGSPGRRA